MIKETAICPLLSSKIREQEIGEVVIKLLLQTFAFLSHNNYAFLSALVLLELLRDHFKVRIH